MTRQALFTKYQRLAEKMSHEWHLVGADRDDVKQELRIALWEATGKWDQSRGVPFEAFAREVMKRRMSDAITAANRLKHQMLSHALRTETSPEDGTVDVIDFIASRELEPPVLLEQLEELRGIVGAILGMTPLERKAIVRVINGFGPEDKADDNALLRARRKLRERREEECRR